MTTIESDLLEQLTQLDRAVQSMKTAQPKPNLLPIFEKIETLAKSLPATVDPQLRHYLDRKSYEKARAWLQDKNG